MSMERWVECTRHEDGQVMYVNMGQVLVVIPVADATLLFSRAGNGLSRETVRETADHFITFKARPEPEQPQDVVTKALHGPRPPGPTLHFNELPEELINPPVPAQGDA